MPGAPFGAARLGVRRRLLSRIAHPSAHLSCDAVRWAESDVVVSEFDAIAASERPATVESLTRDLRTLGVRPGAVVMVHSSLSRLGYVAGGAHSVVVGLLEAVGPDGTIVMPTHSGDLSDPAAWSKPPVPEAWWDTIRSTMPAYDPALTPTRRMGAIVDCFRRLPATRRSAHPTVSVAAHGPRARS